MFVLIFASDFMETKTDLTIFVCIPGALSCIYFCALLFNASGNKAPYLCNLPTPPQFQVLLTDRKIEKKEMDKQRKYTPNLQNYRHPPPLSCGFLLVADNESKSVDRLRNLRFFIHPTPFFGLLFLVANDLVCIARCLARR